MNKAMVLFAGAIFTAAVMGAANDQFSEERHRAKHGRYTPAEESRLQAAQAGSTTSGPEQRGAACCRSLHRHDRLANSTFNASLMEERFRVKNGRNSPAEEARLKATEEELAMHRRKCLDLGQCSLMLAKTAAKARVAGISDSEARLLAKYGRSLPVDERQIARAAKPERERAAALDSVPCEHACCQHGQ